MIITHDLPQKNNNCNQIVFYILFSQYRIVSIAMANKLLTISCRIMVPPRTVSMKTSKNKLKNIFSKRFDMAIIEFFTLLALFHNTLCLANKLIENIFLQVCM